MLIQWRPEGLRLIAQHEHGLLAGELAMAWRGVGDGGRLSDEVVLGIALHDLGWVELDARPRWNPATGFPADFTDFPAEEKFEAAARGIERLEELHPYAAVLVSLHYCSLDAARRPREFEEAEEERRFELLDDLGDDAPGPRRIAADLAHLRLFDNLSLFLCLAPPGAEARSRPSWLTPGLLVPPGAASPLALAWRDETTATLDPFPFEGDGLETDLVCRDLPPGPYGSTEALDEAWESAEEVTLRLRLVSGEGG